MASWPTSRGHLRLEIIRTHAPGPGVGKFKALFSSASAECSRKNPASMPSKVPLPIVAVPESRS